MPELSYRVRAVLFYLSRAILVLVLLGILILAVKFVANKASNSRGVVEAPGASQTTEQPDKADQADPVDAPTDTPDKVADLINDSTKPPAEPVKTKPVVTPKPVIKKKPVKTPRKSDLPNTGPMDVLAFISLPLAVFSVVAWQESRRWLSNPDRF